MQQERKGRAGKTRVIHGSGNVFADLRFPDAAERQAKVRLALELNKIWRAASCARWMRQNC